MRVGDRVELVDEAYGRARKGDRGAIVAISRYSNYSLDILYDIEFDDGPRHVMFAHRFKVIKEEEMKYNVGDVLEINSGHLYKKEVVLVDTNKDIIVTRDTDDGTLNAYTEKDLDDTDWTKTPDVKEVTLEEVAEKFNINVSKLRIKE